MIIDVITLFPEAFECILKFGPIRRAMESGALQIRFFNPVDFAPHPKQVDDEPYGGGAGMVMKPEPLYKAISKAKEGFHSSHVVYLSPQGKLLEQEKVRELSRREHLILISGRYKGIDERIMAFVDEEISIGDYVLSGGELPAMVIIDAVARLLPGAMSDPDSWRTDSFEDGLLDAPYYTRPREFMGMKVPDVLLSGHHEKIEKWRRYQRLKRTLLKRPDLLKKARLSEEDRRILEEIRREMGMDD